MKIYRQRKYVKDKDFRQIQYLKEGKWFIIDYAKTEKEAKRIVKELNKKVVKK